MYRTFSNGRSFLGIPDKPGGSSNATALNFVIPDLIHAGSSNLQSEMR